MNRREFCKALSATVFAISLPVSLTSLYEEKVVYNFVIDRVEVVRSPFDFGYVVRGLAISKDDPTKAKYFALSSDIVDIQDQKGIDRFIEKEAKPLIKKAFLEDLRNAA